MDYSNHVALHKPYLNISETGNVPTTTQTFNIALPCSGLVAAEVNVTIKLHVHLNPNNLTLALLRKKICLTSEFDAHQISPIVIDTVPVQSSSVNIFYIAVGCATALMVIIVMFVPIYNFKYSKGRRQADIIQVNINNFNQKNIENISETKQIYYNFLDFLLILMNCVLGFKKRFEFKWPSSYHIFISRYAYTT